MFFAQSVDRKNWRRTRGRLRPRSVRGPSQKGTTHTDSKKRPKPLAFESYMPIPSARNEPVIVCNRWCAPGISAVSLVQQKADSPRRKPDPWN